MTKRIVQGVSTALAIGLIATSAQPDESTEIGPTPLAFITSAFDRMFNYPSVRSIELSIVRNGRPAGRRVFDVAYQEIDGQGHTILRFKKPSYLRGSALLMIEAEDENLTWLYRPGEQRARRVSTYQKSDSFYGTDLAYEDLENRSWDNYRLRFLPNARLGGREFIRVEAAPLGHSRYSQVTLWVEVGTKAIGRIEFYRHADDVPEKVISVDLDHLIVEGELFKPTTMKVEIVGREWHTDVKFTRIEVNPAITKEAFAQMRLYDEGADLFRMTDRLSAEPDQN